MPRDWMVITTYSGRLLAGGWQDHGIMLDKRKNPEEGGGEAEKMNGSPVGYQRTNSPVNFYTPKAFSH